MVFFNKIYKSDILKNSFIYVLADGVNKGMNFLILPFLTYYISPSGMGIVTNFNVLVQILSLLAGITMINVLPFIFYKKTKEEIQGYVSNLIYVILFLSFFFLFLLFLLKKIIYLHLELDFTLQFYTSIYVVSYLVIQINLVLLRLENKPFSFAMFSFLQTLVNVLCTILLVILFHYEYEGRIWGMVLTNILFAVYSLYSLYKLKYINTKYDWQYIKESLLFGIPLIPHAMSFWLKSGADKIFITKFAGLAENGIYSIAMTMCGILVMLVTSFSNAYTPYLQKRIDTVSEDKKEKNKKIIVRQAYWVALGFSVLYILSVIIGNLCIRYFINEKYIDAVYYTPWLFLTVLFQAFYLLVVNYIYNAKKTLGLGIITFSISLLQIILAYFLIKEVGTIGAAYASALGMFLIFIVVWFYSNKVYPMPWFSFK